MKRFVSLLALIILLGFGFPQLSFASTGDDEGQSSLEKGAPVRNLMLLRAKRFELQPQASFGIDEEFYHTIAFGGGVAYYFLNTLGVAANFVYAPVHVNSGEIDAIEDPNYPADVRNTLAVAQTQMSFDIDIVYAPFIGKMNLFGWILNYDVHLIAGFGGVITNGVCASGENNCENYMNPALDGINFAGVLGVGVRLFFNNFVALNLEIRDYLMSSNGYYSRYSNHDTSGFRNYATGNVGISFFFPTTVYMSR